MALALRGGGVTSCCFLIIAPCCERRRVGLLWFMSSVVARFKRGVTSCCYLIITPLIISADIENFQSSHGCHLRRVVIYFCEIWKSTNRCTIVNFESRSSDFDAGDRGVTSCCYLIIAPCCASLFLLTLKIFKFENPPIGALRITQHDSDSRYYRYDRIRNGRITNVLHDVIF